MRVPKRPLLCDRRCLQQHGEKWGIDTAEIHKEVSFARLLCTQELCLRGLDFGFYFSHEANKRTQTIAQINCHMILTARIIGPIYLQTVHIGMR